jgi:hypothetical protein
LILASFRSSLCCEYLYKTDKDNSSIEKIEFVLDEASCPHSYHLDNDFDSKYHSERRVEDGKDLLGGLLEVRKFVHRENDSIRYNDKKNETVEDWAVHDVEANPGQWVFVVLIVLLKCCRALYHLSPCALLLLIL